MLRHGLVKEELEPIGKHIIQSGVYFREKRANKRENRSLFLDEKEPMRDWSGFYLGLQEPMTARSRARENTRGVGSGRESH